MAKYSRTGAVSCDKYSDQACLVLVFFPGQTWWVLVAQREWEWALVSLEAGMCLGQNQDVQDQQCLVFEGVLQVLAAWVGPLCAQVGPLSTYPAQRVALLFCVASAAQLDLSPNNLATARGPGASTAAQALGGSRFPIHSVIFMQA